MNVNSKLKVVCKQYDHKLYKPSKMQEQIWILTKAVAHPCNKPDFLLAKIQGPQSYFRYTLLATR